MQKKKNYCSNMCYKLGCVCRILFDRCDTFIASSEASLGLPELAESATNSLCDDELLYMNYSAHFQDSLPSEVVVAMSHDWSSKKIYIYLYISGKCLLRDMGVL